jgi:hypothetical protein
MALAAGAWRWQQEHGTGSSSEVCKIITKMTVLVLAQITSLWKLLSVLSAHASLHIQQAYLQLKVNSMVVRMNTCASN